MKKTKRKWFSQLTGREKVLYGLEGAGIATLAAFLCFRSVLVLLAAPPFIAGFLHFKEDQKKHKIYLAQQTEFKNLMANLYSTTAAGGTLEKALRDALQEMRHSGGRYPVLMPQMERVIVELDRNIPMDTVLDHFGKRCGDPEIQHFVQVLKAAASSGGSLADIIRRTSEMAALRAEMNMEIETMLAGRKAELKVMLAVPAGILLYMNLGSPEYMMVLYQAAAGRVIMCMALALYLAAFVIGRRILNVHV